MTRVRHDVRSKTAGLGRPPKGGSRSVLGGADGGSNRRLHGCTAPGVGVHLRSEVALALRGANRHVIRSGIALALPGRG